jgi:hypothetical protein
MPKMDQMRIFATPEARTLILDKGGLLFVWATTGVVRFLRTSTEPPPDALAWQRIECKGVLVFLPPRHRLPRELHLEVGGRLRRRIDAFWNGCAYVV